MLTSVLILQAIGLSLSQGQTRNFANGASFLGLGSSTTEGPIYEPIRGLSPNQHGYTLIDPKYARQFARRPSLNGNVQRGQTADFDRELEAQNAFGRQVAEANKNREFRPSQPVFDKENFRFSSEFQQPSQQSELSSEGFIRNPPPPPPPPKFQSNFEQHHSSVRRPPAMATPPPPPSLKNFPSSQIQTTNPPLVIPELSNQDLPEHPPSLFADDNNNFQMIEFHKTSRPVESQTISHRAPVIRHRDRPLPRRKTIGLTGFPNFPTEATFEAETTSAPPVHKKRVHVIDKPITSDDVAIQETEDLNEETAKEQASRAQYEFQSSIQDSVNGQEQIRQESRDGLSLKGLYSYSDGFFKRTVYYVADENGYRVVKEESEPIGSGPQYDPDGQVNVESSFGGSSHSYSITGQQLESAKKKNSFKQ